MSAPNLISIRQQLERGLWAPRPGIGKNVFRHSGRGPDSASFGRIRAEQGPVGYVVTLAMEAGAEQATARN